MLRLRNQHRRQVHRRCRCAGEARRGGETLWGHWHEGGGDEERVSEHAEGVCGTFAEPVLHARRAHVAGWEGRQEDYEQEVWRGDEADWRGVDAGNSGGVEALRRGMYVI